MGQRGRIHPTPPTYFIFNHSPFQQFRCLWLFYANTLLLIQRYCVWRINKICSSFDIYETYIFYMFLHSSSCVIYFRWRLIPSIKKSLITDPSIYVVYTKSAKLSAVSWSSDTHSMHQEVFTNMQISQLIQQYMTIEKLTWVSQRNYISKMNECY